jgi:hypothetical protein
MKRTDAKTRTPLAHSKLQPRCWAQGAKAQLLSVAGQMRKSFQEQQSAWSSIGTPSEIEMVKSFVTDPESFLSPHKSDMSVLQAAQHSFHPKYTQQSTQIQGILKGIYDGFMAELEKANKAEAESQKSYEQLMETKQAEKNTLSASLLNQESTFAEITKKLTEAKMLRDNTREQLAADETFFEDTKQACATRATEWSTCSRMRIEELNGMDTAIRILSNSEAEKTFESSANTLLLQLSSFQKHRGSTKTFYRLKMLATELHSVQLARLAAEVKTHGHFDKITAKIDMMIGTLRKEEQADIAHRDLCENAQNANRNSLEDTDDAIKKTDNALKRLKNTKTDLQADITQLEKAIKASGTSIKELVEFRNKEEAEFQQSQKDDTEAHDLILKARDALLKFYVNNKIPFALTQQPKWSGSEYSGRKLESKGIVAILEMLAEDVAKEIQEAAADDANAEASFKKQLASLKKTLGAQEETKANSEIALADLDENMDGKNAFKKGRSDDKLAELDAKTALEADCKWVEVTFESRRKKRKDEIDGLVEAKAYLADIDAGQTVLPIP